MTTPHLRKSIGGSLVRRGFILIALGLACLAFSSRVEAALGAQDTAYGSGALVSEAGGNNNSAFGYAALNLNNTGNYNTAVGSQALSQNNTGFRERGQRLSSAPKQHNH